MAKLNEVSPEGWHGTVAAMLQHHPDKFSKEACKWSVAKRKREGKLCPWAQAWSDKEKGDKPHYKDQKTSLKGKPKKKEKYKEYLNASGPFLPGKRGKRSKKKMKTFHEFLEEKGFDASKE